MRRRRRKCRIWWPIYLSQQQLASSFLFGWFVSASSSDASCDIVVAFACDQSALSSSTLPLKEMLIEANTSMPSFLQDKCKFSPLGYYQANCTSNGQLVRGVEHVTDKQNSLTNQNMSGTNHRKGSCGCQNFDGLFERCRLAGLENNTWVHLISGISDKPRKVPELDHIHWRKETMSKLELDLHVIFYEIPTFGDNNYSVGIQSSSIKGVSPCRKPKWFEGLHQKDPEIDLDTVILAINSVNAAQKLFSHHLHSERSVIKFHIVCMLACFAWQVFAVSAASFSTVLYIILQSLHALLSYVSNSFLCIILAKIFSNTWKNIHIRCSQLLYWPIFLQDHGIRSQSCVEFAEKASIRKHSMWSSIVVDIILGNLLGIFIWLQAEPVCTWASNLSRDITNYWLRIGCVWLMGNPAGFKLNNDLAGVLGIICLNAIQIWSTLWILMGFLIIHFARGLAICGMLFGLTSASALVIDIISVLTTHVHTLHLFLSLLYSQQIQAIAALWRLFRGRKRNPLRQRLDSYDYKVEQHVVGSLLFTPILLLLPTTSGFYIFFTILHTAVSFICIVIEFAISFIHATPYAKIFIWLVRRNRFPSGIWFEITSFQHSRTKNPETGNESNVLVSFLLSNYLNLGEVVAPHYRYVCSSFSRSSIAFAAYGLLTGKSVPTALGARLPPKLPWMVIPWREYWWLCYDAIYKCKSNLYSYSRI